MELNFEEAFTFMFKDDNFWKKYIIGAILMTVALCPMFLIMIFVPPTNKLYPLYINATSLFTSIFSIFYMGYTFILANRKVISNENSLPDWGRDLKKILITGLKYLAGSTLFMMVFYFLLLIFCIIFLCIFGFAIGTSTGFSNNPDFVALFQQNPSLLLIPLIGIILLLILIFVVTFLFSMGYYAFLSDLKILSFFNLKRMADIIKQNILNFVVLGIFAILVAGLYMIIFVINKFLYLGFAAIAGFYLALVISHLNGQFVQIGLQKAIKRLEAKEANAN